MRKSVVAFLVVGPGEAGRKLEPVLQQLHWCDEICIVINNAEPATKDMCYWYGTILLEDDREWGVNQWRIKQDALAAFSKLVHADHIETWVWCLDADEIFDPRFDEAMAIKMMSGKDVAWYFWCLQLWNAEDAVRLDLSFPNIRFYKLLPELGLNFQATALHCGLAPTYAYRFGSQSGLWFKHYGLMGAADRKRKVERYDLYDPAAKYKGKSWYDALRNEKARSVPFAEAVRRLPEFIWRSKPLSNTRMSHKNKDRKIFIFTNRHGKAVEAVGDRQREQFLKAGYVERSEISVSAAKEAPVIVTPETKKALDEVAAPAPAAAKKPAAKKPAAKAAK